jgi:hypothetical protein
MTRSHRTVKTLARRLSGNLLMWSVLAGSVNQTALAGQDRQQFPADAAGQAHLTARHSSSVTQLHTDDESAVPQFDEARLPPNLVVAAPLRQVLESMLRDSPTFRRQCARLSHSSLTTISVDQVLIAATAPSRAVTDLSFDRDGRMLAHVQLGQSADPEELIAHEFEHIIEQLDGVDLPSLARRATAGVRLTQDVDRFETERAVAMGRQVTHEIRTARRKRM